MSAEMNEEGVLEVDDEMWDLSDEELEKAFKEAKAGTVEVDTHEEQDLESADDEESADEEIEFEDGPEQPADEDSDHDTGEDEEEETSEEEDEESKEDGQPEEEPESEEDSATESEGESKSNSQEAKKLTFKADGKEFDFTVDEILEQFPKVFGQAMNYTRKMQAIKPWRKTIDAIEQAQLSQDDLNLAIDALKGNKDAIKEVLKKANVDPIDLSLEGGEDEPYTPTDYGRDEKVLEIEDIVKSISSDPEFVVTENILANQWDNQSWQMVSENPEMIRLLHEDVRSGMYDKLAPIMNKLKVYDGARRPDIEYYKEAATQYFSDLTAKQQQEWMLQQQKAKEESRKREQLERAKSEQSKRTANKQAKAKRKAAAPSANSVSNPSSSIDYLDDSDEAFEEWYNKIMDR